MAWKSLIPVLLMLTVTVPTVHAQPWWSIAYGGDEWVVGQYLIGDEDIVYIIGSGINVSNGEWDAILLAVNSTNGRPLWGNIYSGGGNESATGIVELPNGNLLLSGITMDPNSKETFLLVLDRNGRVLNSLTLTDVSGLVIPNDDGLWFVGDSGKSVIVAMLDWELNVVWAKAYRTAGSDISFSVRDAIKYRDGLILAGIMNHKVGFAMRINDRGEVLWAKSFPAELEGELEYSYAYYLSIDTDGNIYLSGNTIGYNSLSYRSEPDAWILKLSPDGEKIWGIRTGTTLPETTFIGDTAAQVVPMGNGQIAVPGYSIADEPTTYVDWVVILNQNGSIVSSETINPEGRFYFLGDSMSLDNDLLLTGRIFIKENVSYYVLLSKLPTKGLGWKSEAKIFVVPDSTRAKELILTSDVFGLDIVSSNYTFVPWNPDVKTIAKLEPAILKIFTVPPNSTVFIDGEEAGLSPLSIPIVPGEHRVEVVKEHYLPRTLTVNLSSGEKRNLTAELIPKNATLGIESDPPNSTVFVDSAPMGNTPLSLELPPGKHLVKVVAKGYIPLNVSLDLNPDENRSVLLRLAPLPCRLQVITTPQATIIINGTEKKSPANFTLRPGNYTVLITRWNYSKEIEMVNCPPNGSMTIEKSLKPLPGTLKVLAPTGSKVYVDGVFVGNGSIEINVSVGDHKVEVTIGNDTRLYDIHMPPNRTITIDVNGTLTHSTKKNPEKAERTSSSYSSGGLDFEQAKKGSEEICGPGIAVLFALLPILRRKSS